VGDYLNETLTGTLIANPPYGERLDPESVRIIHEEIARLFAKNPTLNGGVITAFQEFDNMARGNAWKKRKLMSGGLPCEYFLHKGA
jgi:putative N6-adenine-specific DNA methylase